METYCWRNFSSLLVYFLSHVARFQQMAFSEFWTFKASYASLDTILASYGIQTESVLLP